MKFSASTMGFYDPVIHATIPDDAVDITSEDYYRLLNGQTNGKIISANAHGYPVLIDTLGPTSTELQAACKQKAKELLEKTDYTQVSDIAVVLINVEEFRNYRSLIRSLFLNPVDQPSWPNEPIAQWRT